ncbi:MAG: hypothetical protein FJ104_01435 [Deltaproteobacteria bacterium]|nr:hypothetical protein [Deltaproteobacteria bacterium]
MKKARAMCIMGLAATTVVGCASTQVKFDDAIRQATVELREGRLDDAENSIGSAARLAAGRSDRAKVSDLRLLVLGTRSYMNGEIGAATGQWSQIHDGSLRSQVLAQAGVDDVAKGGRQ